MKMSDRIEKRKAVAAIRRATVCDRCGEQPIEWHNEDHPSKPERRIANMVRGKASLQETLQEILRCTPLCIKCHRIVDGRAVRLLQARMAIPKKVTKTCLCGGGVVVAKGMCSKCYKSKNKEKSNEARRKRRARGRAR